jgi:hypothetical protein
MPDLTTTSEPSLSEQPLEQGESGIATAGGAITGAVFVLIQFDVCEEIKLNRLSEIIGAGSKARTVAQPSMKHPAPGYIRYERPPVVEPIEPLNLESGERLEGEVKYYDYGVLSVVFRLPFAGDWETLIRLASRWVWDVDFSAYAARIVKQRLERAAPALVKPYQDWLSEDYFVFHVREIAGISTASELLKQHGPLIAQIVRGERSRLADSESNEVLQSNISFYPNDLAVIGWNAGFLYDTPAGAESAVQLLEYANSQLLEFRHYDVLLTQELESVYSSLEKGRGFFRRWGMARSASKLYRGLLEVMELTEHADNAIKFLSDMFAARLYRLAAAKIGVPDYKNLVTAKLRTADDLYRFMVDEFNQSRAFLLESAVVVILVIELIFLFYGKPF